MGSFVLWLPVGFSQWGPQQETGEKEESKFGAFFLWLFFPD
jgi:hypothetical protein